MSVLSWGLCTIKHATSLNGAPVGNFTAIPVPKEDTTQLTPTAGNEVNATQEGGDLVDSRTGKTTYVLTFDLFVKKGEQAPFSDSDGVVSGEHAFKVIPEDEGCFGLKIDRATLRVDVVYASADGILLRHTAKCLKPATGNTVKLYTEGGLTVTPGALYFDAEADSTGKTITATSTGDVTASCAQSWVTVTTAAKVATVKVSANETGEPRTAYVTLTADGKSTVVEVLQIP